LEDEVSKFDAPGAAAGFYYQARIALLESLRFVYRESGIEIAIERFDDVTFDNNGTALERLQTKHHVNKKGDLTDFSVDLWKTVRVWSEATKDDPSLPSRIRLALVTTGLAPEGSAASYLRPKGVGATPRNPQAALALLQSAAKSSENKALVTAFAAFLSLAPEIQNSLLTAVEILDVAPTLTALEGSLEDALRIIAPRGKASAAREQLEGWWYPRIFKALEEGKGTIPILDLEAKLDDVRELMRRDALPTDMEEVDPPASELAALDEMNFVRQLQAVGTGNNRVQFAKRDYYRASTQRSKWARLSLLVDGEVGRFERMLVEEWQPRFQRMCDVLGESATPSDVRSAGQELYYWVESEARFPFRTVTARFMSVGSYHILANDFRVGWHKDFEGMRGPPRGDDDGE
jgi:hypothetical protein